VCGYFKEPIHESVEDRRDFLIRRKIALWDMVTSCEIVGSSDATIKNPETADLTQILQTAPIKKILLNGNVAYSLFCKKYQGISLPYEKLPSTSPANPRFNEEVWWRALDDVFRIS
jgi:hypoxanthine-DNA glycosylase